MSNNRQLRGVWGEEYWFLTSNIQESSSDSHSSTFSLKFYDSVKFSIPHSVVLFLDHVPYHKHKRSLHRLHSSASSRYLCHPHNFSGGGCNVICNRNTIPHAVFIDRRGYFYKKKRGQAKRFWKCSKFPWQNYKTTLPKTLHWICKEQGLLNSDTSCPREVRVWIRPLKLPAKLLEKIKSYGGILRYHDLQERNSDARKA